MAPKRSGQRGPEPPESPPGSVSDGDAQGKWVKAGVDVASGSARVLEHLEQLEASFMQRAKQAVDESREREIIDNVKTPALKAGATLVKMFGKEPGNKVPLEGAKGLFTGRRGDDWRLVSKRRKISGRRLARLSHGLQSRDTLKKAEVRAVGG